MLSEEEFMQIYRTLWKNLYRIGYSYLQDKSATQELVKNVFVKLWLKRNEIEKLKSIESYLLQYLQEDIYEYLTKIKSSGGADPQKAGANDDEASILPVKFDIPFYEMEPDLNVANSIISTTRQSDKIIDHPVAQMLKKLRVRLTMFLS